MAQTVHLTLKINDTVIPGESTQVADARKDTIECVYFESSVTTPRNPSSGAATGRRQHRPLKIRKRIDKSTVEISKALCQNKTCEAKFDFYRPAKGKDSGSDELFFWVELKDAHISEVRMVMPDTFDNPGDVREPYEEITFVFDRISWSFNKGASHADSWSGAE